jgi:hypothetical protein
MLGLAPAASDGVAPSAKSGVETPEKTAPNPADEHKVRQETRPATKPRAPEAATGKDATDARPVGSSAASSSDLEDDVLPVSRSRGKVLLLSAIATAALVGAAVALTRSRPEQAQPAEHAESSPAAQPVASSEPSESESPGAEAARAQPAADAESIGREARVADAGGLSPVPEPSAVPAPEPIRGATTAKRPAPKPAPRKSAPKAPPAGKPKPKAREKPAAIVREAPF